MPFNLLLMRARMCLPFMTLSCALSACSTPSVITQGALPCPALVKASGMLDRTPGAPLPADDTAGSLAIFGLQQTGQLGRANADKKGAAAILETCQQWQDKATAAVKPKPWWKIWG